MKINCNIYLLFPHLIFNSRSASKNLSTYNYVPKQQKHTQIAPPSHQITRKLILLKKNPKVRKSEEKEESYDLIFPR